MLPHEENREEQERHSQGAGGDWAGWKGLASVSEAGADRHRSVARGPVIPEPRHIVAGTLVVRGCL